MTQKCFAKAQKAKKKWREEIADDLVSFWQESSLAEADEATVCPHASVSAGVVEAFGDSLAEGVSFAELEQVVVDEESDLVLEESELGEDATKVARGWALFGELAFLVQFNEWRGNFVFENAFFAGEVQVVTALDNVFSWGLSNWIKTKT